MKAMKQAASGGMMRGPRGGMYRIVGGKKVYGTGPSGGKTAHTPEFASKEYSAIIRMAQTFPKASPADLHKKLIESHAASASYQKWHGEGYASDKDRGLRREARGRLDKARGHEDLSRYFANHGDPVNMIRRVLKDSADRVEAHKAKKT